MGERETEVDKKSGEPTRGRRRFSAADKQRMLTEAAAPGQSISRVARKYGVTSSLLFRWRKLLEEAALDRPNAEVRGVAESVLKALRAQVRELQRLLGKKTQENEVLRDVIEIACEKRLLSPAALSRLAGHPASAVAQALQIFGSNVHRNQFVRESRAEGLEDELLARIRAVTSH